ncbi:heavy-metal-associated domain-containing protein [[Mycoplasma] testudinis]|uniref:heavy-metal-associated domain-containing protein n=1 Tax=[Mycoplasma] testudinis TaxID=33924 RepID=UPI000482014B|nr:heavy metal-associated domain-containing protein [[Mycoplasma] testudinis]
MNTKSILLKVQDMTCVSCAAAITMKLEKMQLVNFSVDVVSQEIEVEYDENVASREAILDAIKKAGYKSEVIEE